MVCEVDVELLEQGQLLGDLGETVAVTLTVEDAAKKREKVTVQVPVKPIGYSAPAPAHHH